MTLYFRHLDILHRITLANYIFKNSIWVFVEKLDRLYPSIEYLNCLMTIVGDSE